MRITSAVTAVLAVAPVAFALEVSEKPVKTFQREAGDGETSSVTWSAKGDVVVSSGDRAVYAWDAATGEQMNRTTHGPPQGRAVMVFCVAAYPLAPVLCHCSERGIKFNLLGAHGRVPSFEPKHRETPTCLAFSADGDHMASADRGGEVIIWNLWTGDPERRFQAGKELVFWLAYHPDANRVAAVSRDGKCRIFDTKENKLLLEIAAHEGKAIGVAFSADGKWLATAGEDKKVQVWSADDGKLAATLEGHADTIQSLAFQPSKGSPVLASCGDDKTLRLWDVVAKAELKKVALEEKAACVAWRPDGAALAVGAGARTQVFEVK